jgi:hypothetical protein
MMHQYYRCVVQRSCQLAPGMAWHKPTSVRLCCLLRQQFHLRVLPCCASDLLLHSCRHDWCVSAGMPAAKAAAGRPLHPLQFRKKTRSLHSVHPDKRGHLPSCTLASEPRATSCASMHLGRDLGGSTASRWCVVNEHSHTNPDCETNFCGKHSYTLAHRVRATTASVRAATSWFARFSCSTDCCLK